MVTWRRALSFIAAAGVAALLLFNAGTSPTRQMSPGVAPAHEERRAQGEEGEREALNGVTANPSGATVTSQARVVPDSHHDVSPALRSLPEAKNRPGSRSVPEFEGVREPSNRTVVDPVVQGSSLIRASAGMPATNQSFAGMGNILGYNPPDTNGDVGPNHYVQTVNVNVRVWNKTGTPLTSPVDINSLWSGFGGVCETTNEGDPIVLYDPMADRWLISQFAFDVDGGGNPIAPFYQCVAVSTTADPAGTYYRYSFLSPSSRFNDYGKFGVWPDAYYLSTNEFSAAGSFLGVGAWAMDRTNMLAGNAASMQYFHLGTSYFGLLPSDLDGSTAPPAGAPNPFVEYDDWSSPGNYYLKVMNFHVDWAAPASSTFTSAATIPVAAFDSDLCGYASCMPQPGTSAVVDTLSDRLMFRLAYRNLGDHQAMVVTHTVDVGSDHAGVRWYEMRRTTGSWSVYQQGTYAPDSSNRWMPSAAMDGSGNIAVGYSHGSASIYPGLAYAGRLSTDPPGALSQGEATLVAGGGSQTGGGGRWGDYSSMSVDPSDDCTFWYTSEYYASTSAQGWVTRIGSFKFPSCGGVLPTQHTLSVTVAGSGSVLSTPAAIDCPGTCSANFDDGQSVDLTATADPGFAFTGWSGACTGSSNPCTVSMTAPQSATATFTGGGGGGLTPTSTTGYVSKYYGQAGEYYLYHLGRNVIYSATVAPATGGNLDFEMYKWNRASGTWKYYAGASFLQNASGSVAVKIRPGKGRYAIRGNFAGDATYDVSSADWSYLRVTR